MGTSELFTFLSRAESWPRGADLGHKSRVEAQTSVWFHSDSFHWCLLGVRANIAYHASRSQASATECWVTLVKYYGHSITGVSCNTA